MGFTFWLLCGLGFAFLRFFFFLVKLGAKTYQVILLVQLEILLTKEVTHLCSRKHHTWNPSLNTLCGMVNNTFEVPKHSHFPFKRISSQKIWFAWGHGAFSPWPSSFWLFLEVWNVCIALETVSHALGLKESLFTQCYGLNRKRVPWDRIWNVLPHLVFLSQKTVESLWGGSYLVEGATGYVPHHPAPS